MAKNQQSFVDCSYVSYTWYKSLIVCTFQMIAKNFSAMILLANLTLFTLLSFSFHGLFELYSISMYLEN